MVDPGRGEQQRLPGGTELSREARKDRLPQRLGARRATGLACADDRKPKRLKALLQPLCLDRLPGSLAPFERNEAAPRPLGHRRACVCGALPIATRVKPRRTKPTARPLQAPPQPPPPVGVSCMVQGLLATFR